MLELVVFGNALLLLQLKKKKRKALFFLVVNKMGLQEKCLGSPVYLIS